MKSTVVALSVLLSLACGISAQTTTAPSPAAGQIDKLIAPYLEEHTQMVGRLDLTKLPDDLGLAGLGKAMPKEFQELLKGADPAASQWLKAMRKAGAEQIFLFLTMSDLPQMPAYLVVYTAAESDDKAIHALLTGGAEPAEGQTDMPLQAYQRRGAALLMGSPAQLKRLKENKPAARPEFAQALAAAGDAPLAAAIAFSADDKRVIRETLPTLPDIFGGVSTEPLVKMQWALLAAAPPPKTQVKFLAQCPDADSAKALADGFGQFLKGSFNSARAKEEFPGLDKLAPLLQMKAQGDRAELTLAGQQIDELLATLSPVLAKAREQARQAERAGMLKYLAQGAILNYAESHGGRFPPDFQTLIEAKTVTSQMLVNPNSPDSRPAYIYIPPKELLKDLPKPSERMLIYVPFDKWPGEVGVAFADSHVQWINSEKEFNALLAAAKASAASAPASRPEK